MIIADNGTEQEVLEYIIDVLIGRPVETTRVESALNKVSISNNSLKPVEVIYITLSRKKFVTKMEVTRKKKGVNLFIDTPGELPLSCCTNI